MTCHQTQLGKRVKEPPNQWNLYIYSDCGCFFPCEDANQNQATLCIKHRWGHFMVQLPTPCCYILRPVLKLPPYCSLQIVKGLTTRSQIGEVSAQHQRLPPAQCWLVYYKTALVKPKQLVCLDIHAKKKHNTCLPRLYFGLAPGCTLSHKSSKHNFSLQRSLRLSQAP